MSIQSLLGAGALSLSPVAAKNAGSSSSSAADFSSLLSEAAQKSNATINTQRDADAQMRAQVKQRIMEVGIAKYVEEQKEVEKMMKLLERLMSELDSEPDLKKQVEDIVAHFKENPPQNVDEITSYIEQTIGNLPDITDTNLKQRMEVLFKNLEDLMKKSSEELEKMETLLG